MSVQAVLFDLPGPKARRRHRVIGVVGTLVILAGLAVLTWGLRAQVLNPAMWAPFLMPSTWTAYIIPGLLATLLAAAISVVLAGVVGVIFGLGRLSHNAPVRAVSTVFIEFFRSVPVLMMMIFANAVFSTTGILSGDYQPLAGVVAGLTFYNASVIAELIRAGVDSLPKGQIEAGLAIGLSRSETLRLILLPQAITAMLPSLVSQLVVVLKDTALGYMVAYSDLLRAAQNLSTNYGNLVVAFLVVGVIYIAINAGLTSGGGGLPRWRLICGSVSWR